MVGQEALKRVIGSGGRLMVVQGWGGDHAGEAAANTVLITSVYTTTRAAQRRRKSTQVQASITRTTTTATIVIMTTMIIVIIMRTTARGGVKSEIVIQVLAQGATGRCQQQRGRVEDGLMMVMVRHRVSADVIRRGRRRRRATVWCSRGGRRTLTHGRRRSWWCCYNSRQVHLNNAQQFTLTQRIKVIVRLVRGDQENDLVQECNHVCEQNIQELTCGEQNDRLQTRVFRRIHMQSFQFLHLLLEYPDVVHEGHHAIRSHWRSVESCGGQQRGYVEGHRTLGRVQDKELGPDEP